MHSSVGTEAPANWLITQRSASWSYVTTGSPSPAFWHVPPNPDQTEVIAAGPKTELPVVLSKIWKPSLTIWTYCVAPTSPFVSGGAQLQATPGKTIPSKLSVGAGMFGRASVRWTTVSCASRCLEGSSGFRLPSRSGLLLNGTAGIVRRAGETSFLTEWPTITFEEGAALVTGARCA